MARQRRGAGGSPKGKILSKDSRTPGSTAQKNTSCGRSFCCWCLLPILLLYAAFPVAVRLSIDLQAVLVFCQHIYVPYIHNLSNPQIYNAPRGTRSFFLTTADNETLGVWHVLPDKITHNGLELLQTGKDYERALSAGQPIVVYLHGNAQSRAQRDRVALYKIFASLSYHAISFDYRGFADSTGWPTNETVVDDAMMIWQWVKQRAGNAPVYLWGHSLGTGIGIQLTSRLCKQGSCPDRLVLEAPFTSIEDGACTHPFSLPYRPLLLWSHFKDFFFDNFKVQFNSLMTIDQVSCPTMILHGDEDYFIAYEQGQRLYEKLRSTRAQQGHNDVVFVAAPGFGHKNIHSMPNFSATVQTFFEQ